MKRLLIALLILFISLPTAYAAPVYTYREEIPISESITLTKAEEFHSGHNISYSYIKTDLADENTSLKLLTSKEGTDILDTVGNLAATDENIVAAMNADFFSIFSGNKGFSLGIEIKDGNLIQSPINPDTMATIFYSDNTAGMSYLDFHIMAVAPNWEYHEIRHLNKHTSYFGDILMYTKEFNGGMSPAPGGEVLEVVVSDGKITEFRRNMPPVQIPEDGCVLVVSEGVNMFFANNFNVGDEIRFDYYLTPDISKVQTAFGGGAMLVSEGQPVTDYSHVVAGNNPRSAIGIDKDGTTLYLVAVNGRQESSQGMRMSTLAELMLSLGCYNAVNLDGGGSTNMTASTVWNENMHTVNSPTENRKVINAVGLTYKESDKNPAGIILKSEKNSTFIGHSVKLTAAVHDENLRPTAGEIIWSTDSGTVRDGVFTPTVGGKAVITASCGAASQSTEIYVVDTVSGIDVNSHLRLNEGESAELDIHAFDNDGHYVEVTDAQAFEISSSDSSVVLVSGKTLKAKSEGEAIISVKKDGAVSYTSVTVGFDAKKHIDGFEYPTGSFKAYPSNVGGSFELSSEQVYSGLTSGKLSYDFTEKAEETNEAEETDKAKGAYFALTDRVQLNNAEKTISLQFFTENDFAHELRAQFIDGNGDIAIASFGKEFETGVWNSLTAQIPSSAARPLKLDRIYVLYSPGEAKDSGSVYIDELSFDSVTPGKFSAAQANSYNIETSSGSENGSFAIGALIKNADTFYSKLVNNDVADYISAKSSGALIGQIDSFSTREDKNALYISLDTSNGGIRNTNSAQWDNIVNAISGTSKNNIFLLADDSVFGSSDFENRVIKDYLASVNKNVFVITGGKRNTFKTINGVKYFTLANEEIEKLSTTRMNNQSVLEFNFGSDVSFEWKSLY